MGSRTHTEWESTHMCVMEAVQREQHVSQGGLNNDRLQNPNVMCWNITHTHTHTHVKNIAKIAQSPSLEHVLWMEQQQFQNNSIYDFIPHLFDHFGTLFRK